MKLDEDGFKVHGGTKRTRFRAFTIPNPAGRPTEFACHEADTDDQAMPTRRWVTLKLNQRCSGLFGYRELTDSVGFAKFRKQSAEHLLEIQRRIEAWEDRAVHPGMDGRLWPEGSVSPSICTAFVTWYLIDGDLWKRVGSDVVRLRLPWAGGPPEVQINDGALVADAVRPKSTIGLDARRFGYRGADIDMLGQSDALTPEARSACRQAAAIAAAWSPRTRSLPSNEDLRAWKDENAQSEDEPL